MAERSYQKLKNVADRLVRQTQSPNIPVTALQNKCKKIVEFPLSNKRYRQVWIGRS